jgi:hypothetical protein
MNADLKSLERQLHLEGFLETYVWQDGPNVFYSDHTHRSEVVQLILDGEMAVTEGGVTKVYGAGERCDVRAGAVHSARMGARGCRYLVGEK